MGQRVGGLARTESVDSAGGGGRTGAAPGGIAPSRTLLTLAVRDYGDGDEEFTEGIDEQLAVVREWWGAHDTPDPFRHIPSPELTERHDVERFLHDSGVRELRGRALVVFVTGHGVTGSSNAHFLELPKTDEKRLLATAIRTSEIVTAALDSHAENVLVIVNTCFAGRIQAELASLYEDIRRSRRTECRIDVIVTCDHDSRVLVRRFPGVLRAVLNRLRTSAEITTPWLSVADLLAEFENELGGDSARVRHRLRRVVDGGGQTAVTPCLPNPGYRPVRELVAAARRQVATSADEVDSWLSRASGRPNEQDAGWYFRGRERLNSRTAAFLGSPYGVLLITGTAGSGKSAVLARAVTLSDPEFRHTPAYQQALELAEPATVPPEKSVTAAVLARHRGTAALVADLLLGLDIEPVQPGPEDDTVSLWSAQLAAHLATPGPRVTLVVDGLDEASDPSGIIRDVLAPLSAFCAPGPAAAPGGVPGPRPARRTRQTRELRLLVGVRSSRPLNGTGARDHEPSLLGALRGAFPAARVERTDDAAAEQDIVEYLHALIGPRSCSPDAMVEAVRTVARLVAPSFLDARLAGEQLRSAADPLATVADPEWQELLKAGTTGLLQRDLRLVAAEGLPSDVALALLRASAHAQGAGVPWANVWPAIAEVFLDRPLENPDEAIGKLLNSRLDGYLAHAQEDDRRVYRPAHEALVATLKDKSDELLAHIRDEAS
ncbi:hypothetical protein [Streptomyces sp. NBC_01429]|uniref:hypothetical protein n=1 Tax=Streptomyces sp. NBC_01429 TaxID=2903862 RepID=UPI002E2D08F4|nr:hypothetical protein [Streptomyces sp. NBC_01429]